MSYNVNDILEFTVTYKDTRWQGNVKNVLRYRGHTGELADAQAMGLIEAFVDTVAIRMHSNLGLTTSLRAVKLVNITRQTTPAEEKSYEVEDHPGSITTSTNDVPQASACIVRQAYSRGRKSVGRLFLGPLPNHFIENGEVKKDPLGNGDLQDTLDALGDPLTSGGYTVRPIVCGLKSGSATSSMDVRSNRVSRLVTYMRSRRLGIGE